MSMLDAFFAKGFKGAKCKTLLKLTIPRIKLLRNRREIQLKQMRRDIAKLLETGQEATARIRVEHIVREENMMAAQEIIELFCELIVVRLPIIETQKDCPLDLKEAISTICFAAPRCSDLPELQQIQMLFAAKYGKEFVSAASELMPDCGVNRQVIELLSVRAPTPETKLKLLKEIAEEHELDWDPAATETEFFKSHEDLLNGPTMFIDGSKLPLPEEKHTVPVVLASSEAPTSTDETDLDSALDSLDLPQVPSIPVKPSSGSVEKPELGISQSPNSFATETDEFRKDGNSGSILDDYNSNSQANKQVESIRGVGEEKLLSSVSVESKDRQFLPFMSPPTSSPSSIPTKEEKPSQSISGTSRIMTDAHLDLQDVLADARNAAGTAERAATSQSISSTSKITSDAHVDLQDVLADARNAAGTAERAATSQSISSTSKISSDAHVDLQDVLAAARNAAETAERAAAAARSAASLAEVRISEIIKKRNSLASENSGSGGYEASDLNNTLDVDDPTISSKATFDRNQSFADRIDARYSPDEAANQDQLCPKPSSSDLPKVDHEVGSNSGEHTMENSPIRLPRRLSSLEEDSYFSYPNLFTSANAKSVNESENSSQSTHS